MRPASQAPPPSFPEIAHGREAAAHLLAVLVDRPQMPGLAMPAFDLACAHLGQVSPDLRAAAPADKDPVEEPLLSLRKAVFGHAITILLSDRLF